MHKQPLDMILSDESMRNIKKKKVVVVRKVVKNTKRPNVSSSVVNESAARETSQANVCLDSDQSSDLSETNKKRGRGESNVEQTENQAMASILTEDDANPLSENGESNRLQSSEGPMSATPTNKISEQRGRGS